MEFRQKVDDSFTELKTVISKTALALKTGDDKGQIEQLSKSLARCFYTVNQIVKQVDTERSYLKNLQDDVKSLEKQVEEQEKAKKSLEKFLTLT